MFRKLMFVLFMLVVFGMPVAAQEKIDESAAIDVERSIELISDNLFSLLYNATYLPFAAGLVTVLVSLSKRISYLSRVSSPVMVMFWTVMLWAVWVAANESGYGSQFENMVGALTSIGSVVLGVSVTPMVAGRLYDAARRDGVAVVGYQRPYDVPGVG